MLDFEEDRMLNFVEKLFARKGEKIVAVNQRAFRFGRAAGLFFRAAVTVGMPKLDALRLINKFDAETIDAVHAADWAEATRDDDALIDAVLAEGEAVDCDRVAAVA
jgi:hypothetical protein